jgi:predicted RNA-binding Zn-ribbon protein involved in translation (DUF1610 family)
MPIRFPCTACGQLLGIATRKVGTEIHCPTCGLGVIVPDEEQAKLLREQHRKEKHSFPAFDTPPEISIPREQHEAFDGGLESFLTQLDVSPAASKATSVAPTANVKAPPKPTPPRTPPKAPAAPTSNNKPPATVNGSNGTHVAAPRPTPPAMPAAVKPPAVAAPKSAPPAMEIPVAHLADDDEVVILSAADLLELTDEPLPAPTPPQSAKVVVPSAKVAPPPAAKQPAVLVPPKQKPTAQTPAIVPEIAPLVELVAANENDFGFDFSAVVTAPAPARKSVAVPAPAAPATQPVAAIPAAPFENAVWISRRAIYTHVAILVLVSIVTFLIGWISGGSGARLPGGSNAGPVRFEAQIQYVAANGKTLPDEGAVVLLWPKQAKPLERLSSKRLSPSELPPPPDLPALKALETLRGAYARANAQGEIRDLLLVEPGEYYVLVISRNLARPPQEVINEKVLPILGDLFGAEALTLLGTRQFTLKSYTIAETRTLNHTFGAPAEK